MIDNLPWHYDQFVWIVGDSSNTSVNDLGPRSNSNGGLTGEAFPHIDELTTNNLKNNSFVKQMSKTYSTSCIFFDHPSRSIVLEKRKCDIHAWKIMLNLKRSSWFGWSKIDFKLKSFSSPIYHKK